MIVEESARDEMIDRLTQIAKKVPIGDPLDDKVKVGSLIHRPHLEKVEKYVADGRGEGAELVTGGASLGNGEGGVGDTWPACRKGREIRGGRRRRGGRTGHRRRAPGQCRQLLCADDL